jgi:chaperonin GroES
VWGGCESDPEDCLKISAEYQQKIQAVEVMYAAAAVHIEENIMKPLGDRVIVRRVEEVKPKTLIELPDNSKEKPLHGEVVAIGNRVASREPQELKVKDKILFGKYSGMEVKIKGEDLLILREDEILVVL